MLAHAQEAANSQNDVFDLARLAEDDVADVADLLVGFIVDVNADELGSALFALAVRHSGAVRGGLVRSLGRYRAGEQGRGQHCGGEIF
jgi:hypothetical protein